MSDQLLRVAVIGPESTGKSRLCAELARHYGTVWVPEYARVHLDAKGAPLDADDVEKIARGHLASEEALAGQATRVLFVDTDVIMTTLYADIYYGRCPPWVRKLADERRYDLYLVLAPDVPWVADPQRDLPERRDEFLARCVAALEARGARYVMVTGTWDLRFRTACDAVAAALDDAP